MKNRDSNTGRFLETNNPTYSTIHKWLVAEYGNPTRCVKCGKDGARSIGGNWNIHWACKRGKYVRDVNEFWGLCTSCHNTYDNKIANIKHMRLNLPNPTQYSQEKIDIIVGLRKRGWYLKDIASLTGSSFPTVQKYAKAAWR